MTNPTPTGNGCTLEDCYTNLFALVSFQSRTNEREHGCFDCCCLKCVIKLLRNSGNKDILFLIQEFQQTVPLKKKI